MPAQEMFLDRQVGAERIQVLKTYDTVFAREVFAGMEPDALDHLAESLSVESDEAASGPDSDYADILWDEMADSAREDGQRCSFFVVKRSSSMTGDSLLYVSGDWPSAEQYMRRIQEN